MFRVPMRIVAPFASIVIFFALSTEPAYAPLQVLDAASPVATTFTENERIASIPETTSGANSTELALETSLQTPEMQNAASENEIHRIDNPYAFPPLSADILDNQARTAVVNIHCVSTGQQVGSISGSGVIIDPRGVILTNAHVAQYLLLDSRPEVTISCSVRSGSPARPRWKADVLYLPEEWVIEHAKDIEVEQAKGTGEHDFALLLITESLDNTPLPAILPALPVDTRNAISFTADRVLLAGYPSEFGGNTAHGDMYVSSVFTNIGDLYTYSETDVDLISLGGIALAQGGSSGGAVVNAWGRLVGIISTTSQGSTTAERDLRAITIAYVDRTLQKLSGSDLTTLLSGDIHSKAIQFMTVQAPKLTELLVAEIR